MGVKFKKWKKWESNELKLLLVSKMVIIFITTVNIRAAVVTDIIANQGKTIIKEIFIYLWNWPFYSVLNWYTYLNNDNLILDR